MTRKVLGLLVLASIFLASCENSDAPNAAECPTDIVCTEIFISLLYTPRNGNENIELDSYYSQNLDNGNVYNPTIPISATSPSYVVISDGQLEEIERTGTTIRFFGIVDNEVVIEQDFVVGHDCCHVTALEGPFDE